MDLYLAHYDKYSHSFFIQKFKNVKWKWVICERYLLEHEDFFGMRVIDFPWNFQWDIMGKDGAPCFLSNTC